MSQKAIIRIVGYVAGLSAITVGQTVNQILTAFYVPQPYITVTLSVVGGLITLATLIKGVVDSVKSEVPHGYENVITPRLETDVSDPILLSPPPPLLTTTDTVRKAAT